jgi:DNA-binding LytR/AlgR family response regulator
MSEYTCLIVDDEPPAQRILELYIKDIPMLKLLGKCPNVFKAMEYLQKQKTDILFLDINMPKMSGLEFVKTLSSPPAIVITTAYRDYAVEGFELDVVDYLKKPFPFERFLKAVNKAVEKVNSKKDRYLIQMNQPVVESNFIFIREDKVNYKVNINDIFYIESVGDYIKVFTSGKTYLTYMSLKRICEMLPVTQFIRVHKSFIVATGKIVLIDGNIINIFNARIPIGQSFRKDVVDKLGL